MVIICLATGFEEVEALATVDILRRGDIDAKTVSIMGEKIVEGAHGIRVEADLLFEEVDCKDCEMIILPGGLPGATNLEAHAGLMEQVEAFAATKEKYVAAICASPGLVLAPHGIVNGKKATVYPGMESHLKKGGAKPVSKDACTDGNVITGKGPGAAFAFALEILEQLAGKKVAKEVAEGFLVKR